VLDISLKATAIGAPGENARQPAGIDCRSWRCLPAVGGAEIPAAADIQLPDCARGTGRGRGSEGREHRHRRAGAAANKRDNSIATGNFSGNAVHRPEPATSHHGVYKRPMS